MLKKRIITFLWATPIVIAAVWFDEPLPWFTALVAVFGLLATIEFYTMVRGSQQASPLSYFGLLWVLLFILSPHFGYGRVVPLLLTSAALLPLTWLLLRRHKERAFADWAWTLAGIIYIGWLLSYLVALRGMGSGWVYLTLFATFGSDSAAFFVGSALGRHHMAPHISPRKTWEGAIAGLAGAVIISLLFTLPTPVMLPLNYAQAILLGLLVSVFGQTGDLVESLLKRNMAVKDSGKILPGHGGALDRIDSIAFAGIIVYYYALFSLP